jgi:hypothetical protein
MPGGYLVLSVGGRACWLRKLLDAPLRPGTLFGLLLDVGPVEHVLAVDVVGDKLALVDPIVDGLAFHAKDPLHLGGSHEVLAGDHAGVRCADEFTQLGFLPVFEQLVPFWLSMYP